MPRFHTSIPAHDSSFSMVNLSCDLCCGGDSITAMDKKVYIKTFGCQMNEHDTTKMSLVLRRLGYARTEVMEDADLVLFNTCTIREKAHHKAISEIGRASSIKRSRCDMMIGVCGCVAQQEGRSIIDKYPSVDMVFGPDQIFRLPELIANAQTRHSACALDLVDDAHQYRFMEEVPVHGEGALSAFVMAMKGCNCACSYCIVPSVRGREISRPPDAIVAEVRALAEAGACEVTLLGQNVSAYRTHAGRRGGLAELIGRIARETPIERIRFTSPHPLFIDDALIAEFGSNPKLCPHIHLPAQSGSNQMLKRMRRGYTREIFFEKTEKLKAQRPGMSITTDLIVGFCGESGEDFEQTLDLMRQVRFDSAFAFKYSPRPGTEASREMRDDVPPDEKEARLAELLGLQRRISRERGEALAGDVCEVLATGTDRMQRGLISGRRADNRIVHFAGNPSDVGHIVRVRITGANDNSLRGERCHGGTS